MDTATTATTQPQCSDEIKDLIAALSKAQAAITNAKKDTENPHFKSRYADLASVWDACRKPLTDNGLAVSQQPIMIGDQVVLVTKLLHVSGQWLASYLPVLVERPTAQGLGSGLTYSRRYALAAIVGVAPDDDDDGNAAAQGQQQGKQQRPQGPARGRQQAEGGQRQQGKPAASGGEQQQPTPRPQVSEEIKAARIHLAALAKRYADLSESLGMGKIDWLEIASKAIGKKWETKEPHPLEHFQAAAEAYVAAIASLEAEAGMPGPDDQGEPGANDDPDATGYDA